MDKFIIQWHITHICNLRCVHCYQEEYNNHITKKNFYLILDKLEAFLRDSALTPQINLTGGEPLIHPDFFEFAMAIRKRNIRLGILTNGTLIDEDVAIKLGQLKPVFVQISLDGTEATHDKIRGNGNFQKALQGIDNLKKHGVKVLVSFTAQKENYTEFSTLAKICRQHHVDKLWWDRVVSDDPALYLSSDEFQATASACNKLIHNHNPFVNYSFVSNCRSLQCFGTHDEGYNCNAGKSLLVITADGSVMPCRRLPFVVGNLLTNDIKTIYQNAIMRDLRLFIAPRECIGCQEYVRCKGGSKCVTFAQTGDWKRKDINCPYQ